MVNVLYDMNLAEAEIENNYDLFFNNNEKKQDLLNVILKKHKITKQQFDTSLVWYNAHLDQYFKINEHINKRYTTEMESLQKEIDEENRIREVLSRVNIFKGRNSFFLQQASQLQNTLLFQVDSIDWTPGDSLNISFDILGLNKEIKPELLCYIFCEDTIFTEKEKIEANGSFLKTMTTGMDKVKRLSVSIHISDSIPNANILINKFGIIHRKSWILNDSQDIMNLKEPISIEKNIHLLSK
jgi:hypothetical protein